MRTHQILVIGIEPLKRLYLFVMQTSFSLQSKKAFLCKLWPTLITLCGIYIIFTFDASLFSIIFAVVASVIAWWRSGDIPHRITVREDGHLVFEALIKTTEIEAEDVFKIIVNAYYKEYIVLHRKGRIVIPFGMTKIADFIEQVKQLNPKIIIEQK